MLYLFINFLLRKDKDKLSYVFKNNRNLTAVYFWIFDIFKEEILMKEFINSASLKILG